MSICEHGASLGECVEDGCLYRREVKNALLGLAGSVTAAADQAQAMTDRELGTLLLNSGWSTIEVHEAGRRLLTHAVAREDHDATVNLYGPERVAELEREANK